MKGETAWYANKGTSGEEWEEKCNSKRCQRGSKEMARIGP